MGDKKMFNKKPKNNSPSKIKISELRLPEVVVELTEDESAKLVGGASTIIGGFKSMSGMDSETEILNGPVFVGTLRTTFEF
jgi:hypothetical protein